MSSTSIRRTLNSAPARRNRERLLALPSGAAHIIELGQPRNANKLYVNTYGTELKHPCLIRTLMKHQEAAAIASTRLGRQGNTSLLLYHSAGSGKTLTLWRTAFWWMNRWWAPTLPLTKRGVILPRIIIFIAQREQVDDMSSEMPLFERITLRQKDEMRSHPNFGHAGGERYASAHDEWVHDLPRYKAVLTFNKPNTNRSPPRNFVMHGNDHMLFLKSNLKPGGKTNGEYPYLSISHTCHPLISTPSKKMLPQTYAKLHDPGMYSNGDSNMIPVLFTRWSIHLYIRRCVRDTPGVLRYIPEMRRTAVETSSYMLFLSRLVRQNTAQANHNLLQYGLCDRAGVMLFTMAPKSENDGQRSWAEKAQQSIVSGDMVRFRIGSAASNDTGPNIAMCTDAVTREYWDKYCHLHKGSVSPVYFVQDVRTGPNGAKHMRLKRAFVTDVNELFPSAPSEITRLIERAMHPLNDDGTLRRGFTVHDVYRSNTAIANWRELRPDHIDMHLRDQALPTPFVHAILRASGAQTRTGTPAPGPMWWVGHGRLSETDATSQKDMWLAIDPDLASKSAGACDMPRTLLVAMSAETLVRTYDALPKQALVLVDELQYYIGSQGEHIDKSVRNQVRAMLRTAMNNGTQILNRPPNSGNGGGGGGCIGVMATATPFGGSPSSNDFQRLLRTIGRDADVEAPMLSTTDIRGKDERAVRDMYRKIVAPALRKSGVLVSFIDQDLDPLTTPTISARGMRTRGVVTITRPPGSRARSAPESDVGVVAFKAPAIRQSPPSAASNTTSKSPSRGSSSTRKARASAASPKPKRKSTKAGPSRAKPSRARPSRAKPSRARPQVNVSANAYNTTHSGRVVP